MTYVIGRNIAQYRVGYLEQEAWYIAKKPSKSDKMGSLLAPANLF